PHMQRADSADSASGPEAAAAASASSDAGNLAIQRQNIVHALRLSVKSVLDSAVTRGRTMSEDALSELLTMLDHVFCHGLRPSRGGLLFNERVCNPWPTVEQLPAVCPEAREATQTAQELAGLRGSGLGRLRAWCRLMLMRKSLAQAMRALLQMQEARLRELYLPGALLLHEDAQVVCGLLIGLGVIDYAFDYKRCAPSLLQPLREIRYSLYMAKSFEDDGSAAAQEGPETSALQDQINYQEELLAQLGQQRQALQDRLDRSCRELLDERQASAALRAELTTVKERVAGLEAEKASLQASHEQQKEAVRSDMAVERQTHEESRKGLDQLYQELQRRLKEETQNRFELERELQRQIRERTDLELAVRLLERDVHDKQDSLVTLRRQLEEIKTLSLDLSAKLREREDQLASKTTLVARLESKNEELQAALQRAEQASAEAESQLSGAEEAARKLGRQVAEAEAQRSALEADLRIEREWRVSLQDDLKDAQQQQEEEKSLSRRKEVLSGGSASGVGDPGATAALAEERDRLRETVAGQEQALAEMAGQLSTMKLRLNELSEQNSLGVAGQSAGQQAEWTDERQVTSCQQCNRQFSVARRKHHCRNCGGVFCADCSDQRLPLPSSAKPERVCDSCNTRLLQRYSNASGPAK
ncbi:hypothetical protein BOX15_Mlig015040g1, partial [Macrostomum lignano]